MDVSRSFLIIDLGLPEEVARCHAHCKALLHRGRRGNEEIYFCPRCTPERDLAHSQPSSLPAVSVQSPPLQLVA